MKILQLNFLTCKVKLLMCTYNVSRESNGRMRGKLLSLVTDGKYTCHDDLNCIGGFLLFHKWNCPSLLQVNRVAEGKSEKCDVNGNLTMYTNETFTHSSFHL